MRVLVVGVQWPPETFIARRLVALSALGVEVRVATTAPGARPLDGAPRVQPVSLAAPSPLEIASLAYSRRARHAATAAMHGQGRPSPRRMARWLALARERPDVVHFEWPSVAIAHLPMWDVWDAPVVVSLRGTQINVRPLDGDRPFVDGLRTMFERAHGIHCVSEAIRDVAVPLGLDRDKAAVIRPAIDATRFVPGSERRESNELCVVAVGTWTWVKGYEYALTAIRTVVDAGRAVRLVLVGDGPERQRMLYTIRDLGLVEHVSLLGRLSPADLVGVLQQADVGLLSSVCEGISNSIVEAMACGLPVVTTDCGGMAEVVTDGHEGYVVPARDPAAMARALLTLARDPALRAAMGRRGRARVERELTLDRQAASFLELYRRVAA